MKICIKVSAADNNDLVRNGVNVVEWLESVVRERASELRVLERPTRTKINAVLAQNYVSPVDKVAIIRVLRDAFNLTLMESIQIHVRLAAGHQHKGTFEVVDAERSVKVLDNVGIHMVYALA